MLLSLKKGNSDTTSWMDLWGQDAKWNKLQKAIFYIFHVYEVPRLVVVVTGNRIVFSRGVRESCHVLGLPNLRQPLSHSFFMLWLDKSTKLVLFCFFTWERRGGGGRREKHRFVVPFTYAFIGCFLYVPRPRTEPTTLAPGDNTPTELPGQGWVSHFWKTSYIPDLSVSPPW